MRGKSIDAVRYYPRRGGGGLINFDRNMIYSYLLPAAPPLPEALATRVISLVFNFGLR